MGTVVQFPARGAGAFGAQVRNRLVRFADRTPAVQPLSFGEAPDGSGFCRLGNGLTVCWDRERRLILADTLSGYVDRGPFDGLDEVCFVIERLTA